MYAVYLCGCTDCFLSAIFVIEQDAVAWAEANSGNPEGYKIVIWESTADIDMTDTGWVSSDVEEREYSGTY